GTHAGAVGRAAFRYSGAALNAIPAGTVILVEASSLATAFSDVAEFEVGAYPLLTYDDASPPADPMTGAPTRSAFQADSLGLRCRLRCSWGLRAPRRAWLSGAAWCRRCTTTNSTAPSPRFTPSRTACLRSTANGWRTERRRRARL